MTIAVYPGSFDPITNGHLDILQRASAYFETVIIAVLVNPAKSPLIETPKRIELIKKATANIPNVEVDSFDGLTVTYAVQKKANVIIRGLRAMSDFEKELQMAHANKIMNPEIETFFLMAGLDYTFLSSSMIKEIQLLGGELKNVVPQCVCEYLSELRETRTINER